ncbi:MULTISPECIES: sensor histidine kinase [Rhodococcus]|uniref:sensor histidine kinase n=1 Tax=Rhodococcus TaxID=1827 RepID=UPI000D074CE9|nr:MULTISPECIES: ATP-binding protein [Rhodococcus]AYA24433.1 HAMP domain-containing protein [Rhodococcus rhodochrous]MCD2099436.1 HAMP domain-containing protein [Rhodococcus rhodochrous]MCD2123877.1 HAMP domain-containing protein [Rhodococcus rhodochrous]MCQ4136411.1 ATP-binding protein [Rhodococcus rhodochrous]MDC3724487.1 HAMP domain-containing protein [Rhodococcus sp. Rp3]
MRKFRQHTPDNWRLWRRMTAVVAVPLVAATLYGSLRVYDLYQENDAYSAAAENVSILPTLADYATSVAGAAAATILSIPVDNGAQVARESAATLRDHIDTKDLDPQIAAMINRMLAEGESLLDSASSGTLAPTVASERAEGFVRRAQAAYRAITTTTDDPTVQRESATLLDLWHTQWSLLDQVLAYSALSAGTDGALLMWNNALGVESARLAVLRDTFVENEAADASKVDGLMSQLENRRSLTADLDNEEGNVAALRGSIFESLMVYQEQVAGSATRAVATLDDLAAEARAEALKNAIGIAIVLALALGLAIVIAMSLVRPLRRLRDDTLRTAEQDLPAALAAIKDGAEIESVTLDPVRVHTREEIGEVARAVDSMNEGALRLAGEQAQLRRQVNEMLETLARRNKTLVEQQLALIDSLEHEERDPTRLQNLFALDHLAARMRRTGDSLLVLAGTRQRLGRVPDTPLVDVLRASVSQVENYQRVNIGNAPDGNLVGSAVTDVVHMIAELLDNALRASPPESTVAFAFSRAVDGGLLLEIADRGIGIPADELADINMRLGADGETGSGAARRMGLFVVARLADRHGITVRLRPTFDSTTNAGITASIYLPTSLLKGTGRNYDDPYRIDRPRRLPDPPSEYGEQFHADPASGSQPVVGHRHSAPTPALATPGTSPGIRRGQLHERWVPRGAGQ